MGTIQFETPQRSRSERLVQDALKPSVVAAAALCLAICGIARAQKTSEQTVSIAREQRPVVMLTLPRALAMAAEHNRRLMLAGLAVTDAEQKKDILRSEYFPHIKNESTALHVTALEGVTIPAGAFSQASTTGLIPAQTLHIGQGAQDTFTSGTGLVQPITQLLKVHAGVKAAVADVDIAKSDASGADDSIALLVHKLYFEILSREMQLSAADESVKAAVVTEDESRQGVKDGKALEAASLEAQALLLQQRQASLTVQLAINDLMMQFDDVLGLPLGTKLQLDPDATGEIPALPTVEEAVRLVKETNPAVQSAMFTVEKARAAVAAAKDAYIPDISGMAR